ncbi:MAG: hypothetical protein F6J93_21555 [Oscillatoria sp. SIO1A7]|nr:hypothetical protein [Oscillatoria sp. SIO1A7]
MREVLDPEPKLLWGLAPKARLYGKEDKNISNKNNWKLVEKQKAKIAIEER